MLDAIDKIEAALTVEEFAEVVKYHRESVRRAIRQGRVHALKFGSSYRIPLPEVRRIMATGLPYSEPKISASSLP